RSWMMLVPIQVSQCIGCQVCAQECPTNAITIESSVRELTYARRGPVTHLPPEQGWQPLDAYTRAFPEEPGETPYGDGHAWHVAEETQDYPAETLVCRARRYRGGRPDRAQRGLLPGPARLSRDGFRCHAGGRGHDGDWYPRLSPTARGTLPRHRSNDRPGRRNPPEYRHRARCLAR